MYLLGVNLPDDKVVWVALTRIYGIGPKTGKDICNQLSIPLATRLRDVSESKLVELSTLLNSMKIEAELQREVRNNINNLVQIGCYRGLRHKAGLPVHGQRTRTNARTAKRLNGKQFRAREFSR
ncbi:hypothetical protein HK102_011497 [Quaeritorhiza haematococci]|nr:hypothetical protein HK102_011497 [Quaeritorhiza haematococci]